MINAKQKIVKNNVLYETLTFSTSIEYAIEHLNRLFANEEYNINSKIYEDKISCKFINYKKLTDKQFNNLLNSINFFGYYPSFYMTFNETKTGYYHKKYNENEVRKLVTTSSLFLFYLILEAKYDTEIDINSLPNKLYHITPSENKEKMYKHPDRIYFSLTKEDLDYLKNNSDFRESTKEFVVFEIDVESLKNNKKNIRFFKDKNFKDKGVYTLNNIASQFLKIIY